MLFSMRCNSLTFNFFLNKQVLIASEVVIKSLKLKFKNLIGTTLFATWSGIISLEKGWLTT